MASDEDIIVSCTNADCLLRLRTTPVDLATFMDLYPGRSIPTHVEALATHAAVPCPACESEGRDGTLVYIDDYLRRSPPNKESLIPALREAGLRGADTVEEGRAGRHGLRGGAPGRAQGWRAPRDRARGAPLRRLRAATRQQRS